MFIDRGMDKEDVVHKYMVHRSLLTTPNAGQDVEQQELSITAGGNAE